MNADLKAKWIEALRSGKYAQGKNAMRTTEDTYCCLGVLCDVVDPAAWGASAGYSSYIFKYKNDNRRGYLPWDLAKEIGLSAEMQAQLAAMNDEGDSFQEIAAVIEQEA